ncbi:hypothetical protein LCGC14_0931100 [marine sediment metagenome]|uniref:AB hydrolase-1 domain-containing protein n=1 Tax=marine sediment metagenome TaxID=412755 RepID=A0A0F9R6F7_9ZZZZ
MECDLDNIKVYYEIYGEGYPVLMIHGWYLDHRIMKGCLEPIFETRPNYKRIYFDLPGMGKTKGEEWIKCSDDFLKVTSDFIEKLIPEQNFIIVSESYGSYLARGLIKKKQDLIDGFLFLVPVILPLKDQRELPNPIILIRDTKTFSNLIPFEAELMEDVATLINQKTMERFREEGLFAINIADMEFLNRIQKKRYAFSFDVDKTYNIFDKPTLFFLGRQDSKVGYQNAWKIIEKYPRASFVVLDKAGHIAQIEQEMLFNFLVNDWLNRVEYYISKL